MTRRLGVAALAALAVAPATAAPERTALIVPGEQIGKVRLGMSLAQVRRVLGRPTVVNRQLRTGFGRYVEYDWGWGNWTVGFSGTGSTLRVSLLATGLKREMTRERIGVGVAERRVVSAYRTRGLRCPKVVVERGQPPFPHEYTVCRLVTPNGATTYFRDGCAVPCRSGYVPVVIEVVIRSRAAPRPEYH